VIVPIVVAVAYPPATVGIAILLGALLYMGTHWRESVWSRRVAVMFAIGMYVYFAVAAVMKSSNDPLVSNKWSFYDDGEARGIRWANTNLTERFVWGDFDERVRAASIMESPDDLNAPAARWTNAAQQASVRYIFISDVIRARAERVGGQLPAIENTDRVYDNGSTQVDHYLPETPYQP
jgi:hypothetical protein